MKEEVVTTFLHSKKGTLKFVLNLVLMLVFVGFIASIATKIYLWDASKQNIESFQQFAASIHDFSRAREGASNTILLHMKEGDVIFGFSKYDEPLLLTLTTRAGEEWVEKAMARPGECKQGQACLCLCKSHPVDKQKSINICPEMICSSFQGVDFVTALPHDRMAPSEGMILPGQGYVLRNGIALYNRATLSKVPPGLEPRDAAGLVSMYEPLGSPTQILIEKGKGDSVGVCSYRQGRSCLLPEYEELHLLKQDTMPDYVKGKAAFDKGEYEDAVQTFANILARQPAFESLSISTRQSLLYYKGVAHQSLRQYDDALAAYEAALHVEERGLELYKADIEEKMRWMELCKEPSCEAFPLDQCEQNPCGITCTMRETEMARTGVERVCVSPTPEEERTGGEA